MRVAAAAASALSAAAAGCGPTLQPHLDRFIAATFLASIHHKAPVADAAARALAGDKSHAALRLECRSILVFTQVLACRLRCTAVSARN